jgi:hypothetical protein
MKVLLFASLVTLCAVSFFSVSYIFAFYIVQYQTFVLGVNTTTTVEYHLLFQDTIRQSQMNFGDDSPLETSETLFWLGNYDNNHNNNNNNNNNNNGTSNQIITPQLPTRLKELYIMLEFFIGFCIIFLLTIIVLNIIRCCKFSQTVPNSLRVSVFFVSITSLILAVVSLLLVIFLQPSGWKNDCSIYQIYIPPSCDQGLFSFLFSVFRFLFSVFFIFCLVWF